MKIYLLIETETTYEASSTTVGVYKDEAKAHQDKFSYQERVSPLMVTYYVDEYELIE